METDKEIWAKSRFLKSYVFLMMTEFFLIIFGEIHRETATSMCLAFCEILTRSSAQKYMNVARQLSIDLTRGYLFLPTTPIGGIQDSSFSSTAAEARLKTYFKGMGADEGQTLYGFRWGLCNYTCTYGRRHVRDHGPRRINSPTYRTLLPAVSWNQRGDRLDLSQMEL